MYSLSYRTASTVLVLALLALLALLAGCASVPPASTGTLTSYNGLIKVESLQTQASARADRTVLSTARTVRIEPVAFENAAQAQVTLAQMALIANAMERELCMELGARFEVVSTSDADLTVRTAVTRIKPTDVKIAALSAVISLAIPAPRLPIGMGGFAAEAEAIGPDGAQAAAMIWSRDADAFSGRRVSSIGDAYDLSTKFAQDLSELMTSERLSHTNSAPTDACVRYGTSPSIADTVFGLFGAPPEWTDGGQANR